MARTNEMQRYTMGFIFSPNLKLVYLIRKDHPEWQAGFLNGVGGKVREGENYDVCMAREAQEEAGYTGDWKEFGVMHGDGWYCPVFYSVMSDGQSTPATSEAERIEAVDMDDFVEMQGQMISNVPWLILAAVNHILHEGNKFLLHVTY